MTRPQLAEIGLSPDAIKHRIRRGSLIVVFRNVYAVGHLPTHPHDRAKGALLAAGPRSALTQDSAGSYYGIWRRWHYPLHVVVPTDRRLAGLIIHRNRRLRQSDILEPEPNLRVTSPAITLLDMAPRLHPKRLRRVVNEIRLAHKIPLAELAALLERFPRHPGVPHLSPIVQTSHREPTRSSWEDEWDAFAKRFGLPPYVMNERVSGRRTDIRFLAERLIVELDGKETHDTPDAFASDRDQDAHILAETGMPTVRLTYRNFHRRPAAEAARLLVILERRRRELGELSA